jgi:hypothetical protein
MTDPEIYIAKSGFICSSVEHLGDVAADAELPVIIHMGDTVEAGHWLLTLNPAAFQPLTITHQAPASSVRYPLRGRRSTRH